MYRKFSYEKTPSEAIFVSYGQFKELGQKSINLPDITYSFLLLFTGVEKGYTGNEWVKQWHTVGLSNGKVKTAVLY